MKIVIASWDSIVIVVTLVISAFVVYTSYQRMGLPADTLNERIGNPHWNFSTSWATTLTTVGALLGTVIATPSLSGIHMQSGLSLFFGLVVLIAPLMYTASTKRFPPDPNVKDGPYQYEGTIRMLLLTCLLTVWGVSGELVTVATTFYLLMQESFVSLLALILFGLFLLVAIVYAFRYAYRSIPWTIEDLQADKTTRQQAMQVRNKLSLSNEQPVPEDAKAKLTEEERIQAKSYHPPLKNWTLL